MYADKYDTIFYINNALMPIRQSFKVTKSKVLPTKDSIEFYHWKQTVPGNTSNTLWTKFRPLKDLPQYINPKSGFLFNTNHSSFLATAKEDNLNPKMVKPQDGWEQYHLNRSLRFLELMPQNEKLSYEKFKEIKFDKQLPFTLAYTYKIDSMFALQETDYPELATLISTFKNWNKRGDADSKGAAIFLLGYEYLKNKLQGQTARNITRQEAVETYTHIKSYLQTNFGKEDIVLGDIQKLVRGDKEWPLWGFPDLLSPQWTEKYKDGKLKSVGGDGLVMFVRFAKDSLPKIESINMYGASANPKSKHFDDQVEMYLNQQTKTISLDKEEVYRKAERVYHPN